MRQPPRKTTTPGKFFLRPGSMAECPSPSRSVIMRSILRDSGYLHGRVLDADTLASTPRSHPTARGLGQRQSSGSQPINPPGLYGTAPVGPSVYASGTPRPHDANHGPNS